MKIKTRFAPSPTGMLHVGGARTALYSWLYARHNGGTFLLRIEDTDIARSTPEAIDEIMNAMKWLDLSWDEGPYFQTKRFDRYDEVVEDMLEKGTAYRCYCSKDHLDELRDEQISKGEKALYNRHCRNPKVQAEHSKDEPHCVRFANPIDGTVSFDDMIRGKIEFSNAELDDLIIRRTDGVVTYNFCVVVDDWDMEVTDIVRGEDHISNTAKQVNIFEALGAPMPKFAHLSMILGNDSRKLSKRHGAVGVMQYRDEGYLPEALLNYLVRLGWSHGDQEIFTRDEMIEYFTLDRVSRSASAFNNKKLLWLNHHYINNLPAERVAEELTWHMNQHNYDLANGPSLVEIVQVFGDRCQSLREMAESCAYCYVDDIELTKKQVDKSASYSKQAYRASKTATPVEKYLVAAAVAPLSALKEKLSSLSDWTTENIHNIIETVSKELDLGMGKVGMPFRVAITGQGQTPGIDAVAAILGKARVIARLEKAIEFIQAK